MIPDVIDLARDAIAALPFRWAPGDEPAAFLNVMDFVTLCIDDGIDLLAISRYSPVGVHNYEAEQRDAEDTPAPGSQASVHCSFGTITIMANQWSRRAVQDHSARVEALVGSVSDDVARHLDIGLRRLRGPFKNAAPLRHHAGANIQLAVNVWRNVFGPAQHRLEGLGIPHSFVTRFPTETLGAWTLCQSRLEDGRLTFEPLQHARTLALACRCFRTGLVQHAGAEQTSRQLFVPIHYQGVAWAVVVLTFPSTDAGLISALHLYREGALFESIRARANEAQFDLLDGLSGEASSSAAQQRRSTITAVDLPRLIFPNPHFGYRSADGSSVEADEEGPYQKSGMVLPVERSTPGSDALWAAVKRARLRKPHLSKRNTGGSTDRYVLHWSGDWSEPNLRIAVKGRRDQSEMVEIDHPQDVALFLALLNKHPHGTGLLSKQEIEDVCRVAAREKATTSAQIIQAVRRSLRDRGIDPKAVLKAAHRSGVRLYRHLDVRRGDRPLLPSRGGVVEDLDRFVSQEEEEKWNGKMYPRRSRLRRD